jgi:hypothetical protein
MKLLLLFLVIAFIFCVHRGRNAIDQEVPTMEQLDSLYQNQWNLPRYDSAKSAANATYLTDTEKRIIYYLNLVRLNPELFAGIYAKGYKGSDVVMMWLNESINFKGPNQGVSSSTTSSLNRSLTHPTYRSAGRVKIWAWKGRKAS